MYQLPENSPKSKARPAADYISRTDRSGVQMPVNRLPIQRKLIVEGKPVLVLPDWIEKGQHPEVVRTLSNWVESTGVTFGFGSWTEAVDKVKVLLSAIPDRSGMPGRSVLDRVEAEPHLNEAEIINQVGARFSGRISSVPRTLNAGANPEGNAGQFAAILAVIQRDVQDYLDLNAPGFKCLVRFFVDDANAGKTHPGLNSWAFLRRQQGHEVSSDMSRAEVARSHMLYGHDVDEKSDSSAKSGSTKESLVKDSPMVSTTENIGNLLRADSPFNTARTTALAEGSARNEALASGSASLPARRGRGGLLGQVLRPSAAGTGKAASNRTEGRHVSDRIVILTHGHANASTAQALSNIAVATHLAFLVLPAHRLNRSPADTPKDSCCILESEVTVHAPDADLTRWVIGTVNNRLPALTSRSPQSPFPGKGRRLGGK